MAKSAARYDYRGAVVLVTGGASGIGRACARAFAQAGGHVVIADRDEEAALSAVEEIAGAGGSADQRVVDVSEPEQVDDLIAWTVARHGALDIAHNNAGIEGANVPLAQWPLSSWRKLMAVNLDGVFHCMRAELRQMLAQGSGSIVNTSSISGLIGGYNLSAYIAAKHGVVGLTKAAATEYATAGIRVNAVCPGLVETPFVEHLPEAFRDRLDLATPMNRAARPDEIAHAVLWLASDAASYVTGHSLVIDGGTSLAATGTKFDDLV